MAKHDKAKFQLGKIKTTLFANFALQRAGQKSTQFLNLHKNGNYGEITKEEKQQNDQIVNSNDKTNKQILSAYTTSFNETIWILTRFQNNNIETTILLPREYDYKFYK